MQDRKNTCIWHHYKTSPSVLHLISKQCIKELEFQINGKQTKYFKSLFSFTLCQIFLPCVIVNPLTPWAGPITFQLFAVIKTQFHPVNKSGLVSDSKLSLSLKSDMASGTWSGKEDIFFITTPPPSILRSQIFWEWEQGREICWGTGAGTGRGQTSAYLTGATGILSGQPWLARKARHIGQVPKADSFVGLMSSLTGAPLSLHDSLMGTDGKSYSSSISTILPTPVTSGPSNTPFWCGPLVLWTALLPWTRQPPSAGFSQSTGDSGPLLGWRCWCRLWHSRHPLSEPCGLPPNLPFSGSQGQISKADAWGMRCQSSCLQQTHAGFTNDGLRGPFIWCWRRKTNSRTRHREEGKFPLPPLPWTLHSLPTRPTTLKIPCLQTSYVNCHLPFHPGWVWWQVVAVTFYSLLVSPGGRYLALLCVSSNRGVSEPITFRLGL